LEGQELAHWLEAAIHPTRADEVHEAQQWFEQLWTSAETRAISNQDLSAALVAYECNRKARPDYSPKGHSRSLSISRTSSRCAMPTL
jgi:hypothetical protein